jgi:hypothetical protein
MAIKTNGRSRKKVADFAVENSNKLWKDPEQSFVGWVQLFLGHRLAGGARIEGEVARRRAESGKLGCFQCVA